MAAVTAHQGDCREVLATLAPDSVDACVTDPPYGLRFMGKGWDEGVPGVEFWAAVYRVLKPGAHLLAFSGTRTQHRMVCAIEDAGFEIRDQIGWAYGSGFPKSHNQPGGWGTALKPAWEPICVARKPLIGTVAANVLQYGTGGLNIDGCRVGTDALPASVRGVTRMGTFRGAEGGITPERAGRWPANLIHDGSAEVLACFPDSAAGAPRPDRGRGGIWSPSADGIPAGPQYGDSGTAARFFYSPKADKGDRLGSKHPTVKPVDLMAYLCRLVTPPGGTVLDPFAGSGTTGMAAMREGFDAVLIELEAESVADIRRRLAHVEGADTPLFA